MTVPILCSAAAYVLRKAPKACEGGFLPKSANSYRATMRTPQGDICCAAKEALFDHPAWFIYDPIAASLRAASLSGCVKATRALMYSARYSASRATPEKRPEPQL